MSITTLIDEMIRRLEAERSRNPGCDLLGAQQIVVDVALDHASREAAAARRAEVAITANRLLDGGVR